VDAGQSSDNRSPKEKDKKQILLRLSPSLWQDLARLAEEDFRSINGEIEFLLTESVRSRKRQKR
jgi:hypothetical protein